MVSTETFEARIASALDAVSRHMIGPHLGDQEYAIALTTDCAPNEFLGAVISAVSISIIPSERPVSNASSSTA